MAADEKKLHMSLSLVFLSMCEISGISKGKKSDLSPVAMSIVRASMTKDLKIGDIARANDISYGTATKCVINLEKKGYVRREKGKDDGRTVRVAPTEKALRRVDATEAMMHAYVDAGMSRLSPDEEEQFVDLLARFAGYDDSRSMEELLATALKFGRQER